MGESIRGKKENMAGQAASLSVESNKSPEVNSSFEKLVKVKDSLTNQRSQVAARYAGAFLDGKLTSSEAKRAIENIPDREPLVKRAVQSLEKRGIVRWVDNPEKGGRSMVIDMEALKAIRQPDMRKLGPIFKHPAYGKSNKADALSEIFGDTPVLSKEQLDQNIYVEKPLFYIPKDRDSALSPDAIKKADFHFAFWDVVVGGPQKNREYSTKEGKGSSWFETRMAFTLFHPSAGDGYRDENGNLLIRDHKTREYKNVSAETLIKYGFSIGGFYGISGSTKTARNIRQAIREFFPNLVAKKFLLPEDFRMYGGYKHAEQERAVRTKVTPDGYVMFNGVRHYLGREFYEKPIRIYQLAGNLGGIADIADDGRETLTHTFRVFSKDAAPQTPKGERIAGRKFTELAPFDPEKVSLPKRADEPEEAYGERLEAARDFDFLLSISNDLEPLGTTLHKEDIREQTVIAKAARSLSEKKQYQRFLSFAEKFGEDGVRTFFTTEYDTQNGGRILELSEKLKEGDAEGLFYSYGQIVKSAHGLEKVLRDRAISNTNIEETLKELFPQEVHEAILRRSKDILMAAYAVGVEKKKAMKISEVMHAIEGTQILFEILQSLEDTNTSYRFVEQYDRNDGETQMFLVEHKDTHEQYELKLFVRPRENKEGQARINIELNFDTVQPNQTLKHAFKHPVFYKKKQKTRTMDSLRLAIDLDSHAGKQFISLDLGRGAYESESRSQPGDILGKSLQLASESGHHNPMSFDNRFANPDVFAEITSRFKEYLETKRV